MFPYRIKIKQELKITDKTKRKAEKLLTRWKGAQFLKNLWTLDEAHFHLEKKVNSKYNVYRRYSKPVDCAQKPLHSAKYSV